MKTQKRGVSHGSVTRPLQSHKFALKVPIIFIFGVANLAMYIIWSYIKTPANSHRGFKLIPAAQADVRSTYCSCLSLLYFHLVRLRYVLSSIGHPKVAKVDIVLTQRLRDRHWLDKVRPPPQLL